MNIREYPRLLRKVMQETKEATQSGGVS